MRKTMRAARIREPGRSIVEEAPIPVPERGKVLIAIEGSGVCASNLGAWTGLPRTAYPLRHGEGGHEAYGRVHEVGADVDRSWIGRRVAALCTHAFAEYDVAHVASLVPLPDSLADRDFPAEAFGCAMNVFRRANVREGHTVAVIGVGFIGAIVVRLCKQAGACVIAISRRAYARDLASTMGADVTIPLEDHNAIIDRVREYTGGALCDRTIECVGAQWPLDLAAELTGERGTLVIAGYHQDGARVVNMQLWNWRGIDVVNAHERDPNAYVDAMKRALDSVARGALDPGSLVTHRFDLEDLGAALDACRDRPDGFVKAVVRP